MGKAAPLRAAVAMDFSTIEVAVTGARGSLTLNRADKLNPLSTTTLHELVDAARLFDSRPEVKVVVVAGKGRSFSAGADLAAFERPGDPAGTGAGGTSATISREAADAGRRMAEAIEAMRAVTIARLHGHCVGGALVLAAACDLRVAAEDTRFSIPEVDLGVPLAWGGIPRLVREIGPALTKELVMTCRPFTAAEARAAGFVNRVVPAPLLDAEVEDLVAGLERKSAFTLSATKRHTTAVTDGMVGTARAWNDADSLVTALRDPDSRAAGAAYLERVRRR
ncbi:MAG: enoyl-CoA hydratase/isomerase family protein [Acidimicrobiales bacterium]